MNLVRCQMQLECHQHILKWNISKKTSYIVENIFWKDLDSYYEKQKKKYLRKSNH